MKRRTLYLPIETKYRELLGKTLLAAKAVDRGWRVFLGGIEMHEHMADGLAPGLLIENNIPDTKADRLGRLKHHGYRIADLCEESIIYPDGEDYCARKVGPRSLEATDIILATGARAERDIRTYRRAADKKLVVTGNPRFDTLLPRVRAVHDDDARDLRERYGRFLLVNTNFSVANPYKIGLDVVATLQRDGKLATSAQVDRKRRQVAYKLRHMAGLQSLVVEVCRAGVFDRIVVRPHPSENHDAWRAWASGWNVGVQYEGSASAWMLAADMVLHPGCTTGIEALLLGRPVVSFVPEPASEFLNPADAVSFKVADASELLALAEMFRRADGEQARAHLAAGRTAMRPYIDNVEPPLAADRILDVAEKLDVPATGTGLYALRRACGAMMNVRRWSSRREASRRAQKGYRRQKFPGLSADDVRTPLARWKDVGVLERMPEITLVDRALLRLQ